MTPLHRHLVCLAAGLGCLLASPVAQAGRGPVLNCSISVTYEHTQGSTVLNTETYTRNFSLSEASPYFEDFSTVARQKSFGASVRTERGNTVVNADFFADVGTFSAVAFSTQAAEAGGVVSAAGSQGYFTSLGIAGNHTTQHQLLCSRR
jgi:hypothetical protein